MSSGLKILHVAETVRGGIATYLNELHPHQSASFGPGNVNYVVPSDHRSDLVNIEDDAVTTFPRDGRNAVGLFRMLFATMRAVRQLRPDVIHLHSSFAGLVVRPVLWLTYRRSRIVYCPHGWAFGRETGRLSREVTKFTELVLSKFTHRIVCISESEQADAKQVGIAANRLVLVHNGISKQRPALDKGAAQWRSEKIKVLFIGRLDRQKGYDLLIEAARALGDKLDVRLIGASVVSKFRRSDLPANVSFLGWMNRNQIEAELDQADMVAIPRAGRRLAWSQSRRCGRPSRSLPSASAPCPKSSKTMRRACCATKSRPKSWLKVSNAQPGSTWLRSAVPDMSVSPASTTSNRPTARSVRFMPTSCMCG